MFPFGLKPRFGNFSLFGWQFLQPAAKNITTEGIGW
jgi:hypothetical protein